MRKRHWGAALASLMIVGLGQIIKGEGEKGLKMLLTFYLAFPALAYVSLLINAYLFLLVLGLLLISAAVVWIYNIWDALTHETIL